MPALHTTAIELACRHCIQMPLNWHTTGTPLHVPLELRRFWCVLPCNKDQLCFLQSFLQGLHFTHGACHCQVTCVCACVASLETRIPDVSETRGKHARKKHKGSRAQLRPPPAHGGRPRRSRLRTWTRRTAMHLYLFYSKGTTQHEAGACAPGGSGGARHSRGALPPRPCCAGYRCRAARCV